MKEKVASTAATLTSTSSIAVSGTTVIGSVPAPPAAPSHPLPEAKVDSAVYSYIRAMRAIGKTRLNTAEIAAALGLPEATIRNAAARLSDKGVRAAE
jgi:hypothetical protein